MVELGQRRWLLMSCLASYFLSIVLLYQMSPFFQTYAAKCCAASATTVGLIFSALPFASFLACFRAGGIVEDKGPRVVLGCSLLVLAASSLAFGLSASIEAFFFWRMVQGLASAFVYTSISTQLMQAFPQPEELAFVNGLQETVGNIGFGIGPLLGGALFDWGGFVAPFAMSAIGHTFFVALAAVLPAPPEVGEPLLESDTTEESGDSKICSSKVLCLAGCGAVTISFWGALEPLLAGHFHDVLGHLPASGVGLLLAISAISSSVGAMSTSPLLKRMAAGKVITLGLTVVSVACCVLAMTNPHATELLGIPVLPVSHGSAHAWIVQAILMAIIGVGYSWAWTPVMPEMLSAASELSPDADVSAATAAYFNAAAALGEAMGPALGGLAFAFRGFPCTCMGTAVITALYMGPIGCVLGCRKASEEAEEATELPPRTPSPLLRPALEPHHDFPLHQMPPLLSGTQTRQRSAVGVRGARSRSGSRTRIPSVGRPVSVERSSA